MSDDNKPSAPRRNKSFWWPVWITLTGLVAAALLGWGGHLVEEQWTQSQEAELVVAAMRSPTYAIEDAENRLLEKRIDFSLYRDILRVALTRDDPDLRNAAISSMSRVLNSNLAFAKDLKKELDLMPVQVFLVTPGNDRAESLNVEHKLKLGEIASIIHEKRDQTLRRVEKAEVLCFSREVCKQTGQTIANLLRQEGFEVDSEAPKLIDSGPDWLKKRVDVIFPDLKKAEEAAKPGPTTADGSKKGRDKKKSRRSRRRR